MTSLIRRAILAAALIAGIAPAMAQVPPPVPALPDAPRLTSYSISGSVCACNVNFALYGDSTDYANWIEVYLNGVLMPQFGNWTITSPTGSLATIPRPITDAVLTFAGAQTGTVQIVGARRPRRTSQFNEGVGVPTRNFNVVLSDLTAQNREVWDKLNDVTGRMPRFPPGETQPVFPPASQRANMGVCFDNSGNMVPCVSAGGTTFSAGAGVAFTGTNPTSISVVSGATGSVSPKDFGALCDGSTDDSVALQTAITAAAGKVLQLPSGPGCVTHAMLQVSGNTVIKGTGRDTSGIIGATAAANPIFYIPGVSNVTLQDFACTGTDSATSWTASNYGCVLFLTASSAISNINFINLKLSGFNTTYWIYGNAVTGSITNYTIRNVQFTTAAADVPNDAVPTNDSNGIITIQSGTGGNGQVIQGLIADNVIAGDYACFGITQFGNHYKPRIQNNVITNIGTGSSSHCTNSLASTNAYAILVYDDVADGNPPVNVSVVGNTIINPLSAGIYFTGDGALAHNAANYNSTQGSLIANNFVIGQSAQDDSGVGRGAIVVDFLTDVQVSGNYLQSNFGGIAVQSQRTGVVSVLDNTCTTGVAAGASTPFCIRLDSGINGSSNADTRTVRGNTLQTTGASSNSIRTGSSTGARFNDVDISNNTISSAVLGLNAGNAFASGTIMVNGNSFTGANATAVANFGGITGNLYLNGNKWTGLTVAGLPTAINGSSVFVSDGLPASGPCTGGSTGSTAFRQNGAWKCF